MCWLSHDPFCAHIIRDKKEKKEIHLFNQTDRQRQIDRHQTEGGTDRQINRTDFFSGRTLLLWHLLIIIIQILYYNTIITTLFKLL